MKRFDFEQNSGKLSERNLKRKIRTNRETFSTLSKMAELSNEAEKPKKKNWNKPRNIFDFKRNGGIEQ
ncbi:MAG: hypothetical protein WAW57_13865 [Lutibacter sp.]